MDVFKSDREMTAALQGAVAFDPFTVKDKDKLVGEIDRLVWTAVFGNEARDGARWIIRRAADALGAVSSSIQGLYDAIAAGKTRRFTVPAHNIRGLVYDKARRLFRAARALDAGAFLFEIARSEMAYCELRPAEFSACVLGAAVKEGWQGPVFLQGDHFQFEAKKYFQDPGSVTDEIKALTREAIEAGFYNIDIDSSTLVVLDRPTVKEQQRDNFERCAELTRFIRELQPVEISVGGEIGEVGKKNSTPEEFEAFFEGYRENWDGKALSKMSVQTGTAHGGVVAADGSRADVKIDFDVHRKISAACRRHGLAGTVQHGASTLPERFFDQFPKSDTIEIHLATEFQRMVFDHPRFALKGDLVEWCRKNRPKEWKEDQTEAQNVEKTIKRTWGPFKREIWGLDRSVLDPILDGLEEKFKTLMALLEVPGTRSLVAEFVKPAPVAPAMPAGLRI